MKTREILAVSGALAFVIVAVILARLNRDEESGSAHVTEAVPNESLPTTFPSSAQTARSAAPSASEKVTSISTEAAKTTESTTLNSAAAVESPPQSCGQVLGDKARDTSKDLPEVKRYDSPGAALALDKEACYTAASEARRARHLYDATPTQTVSYNNTVPMMGSDVTRMVLGVICAGDEPFDPKEKFDIELYYVTAEMTTRVTIGKFWISEGTIRSPLTEEQYDKYVMTLSRRRQDVIGPYGNMAREQFDKRMARKAFNLQAAAEDEGIRRDLELRLMQRKLPTDCLAGDDLRDGHRRVPLAD